MLGNSTIKYGLRILFVSLAFILVPRLEMAQVNKKKPAPVPTKPAQNPQSKSTPTTPPHPSPSSSGGSDQNKKQHDPNDSRKRTDKKNDPNDQPKRENHILQPPTTQPHHTGVHPPADSKREPDGKGGTIYKARNGAEYHANKDGNVDSLTTKRGTQAKLGSGGRVATIQMKDGTNIQYGPNGARRIETIGPHGEKVVSDGRGNGYVETKFTRDGQTFESRTIVVNGRVSTRVYQQISYRNQIYYRYVPGYYYAPAFYGWAYSPWVTPVTFGWGWGYAGWYGFYGGYFGAAPFYAGPNFWLTDYVLAADLQAAYAEEVGAPRSGGGPTVTVPGNQAWTDTGKYLNAGDVVNITASGLVSMGGGWTPLPPAGKVPNCGSLGGFPDGQLPCWSLIGRVGDGPIFEVGNGRKIAAQNSGELLLGVNDNILGDNTGNWYATIVAPNVPPPTSNEDSSAKPSDAALTPVVKKEIAEQMQAQIAADKDAAANPSQAANDTQIPAALDPKHSVFIVSSTLSEQTDDGQSCSLTAGDILSRISKTPDDHQNVRVLVTTAKDGDCATGTQFAMSIQDLQDMYNDFQAKMDEGLKQLAEKQGKNGIPRGPAAGGRVNPDGVAPPDASAAASIQQQDQAANQAEADVDQATRPAGGN
jgi:hypothetical protein